MFMCTSCIECTEISRTDDWMNTEREDTFICDQDEQQRRFDNPDIVQDFCPKNK